MKKLLSVLIAAALLAALSCPALGAAAPSRKEEVVYGILSGDGSVEKIYVVNSFYGGDITDYGDYTQIVNLSGSEPLSVSGDMITSKGSQGRLSYQGTLSSKDLPWTFGIKCRLNGREVRFEDLGGADGDLRIDITVGQNPRVTTPFFDDYALQVTVKLDKELCEDIAAEGATIADAGGDKQISFTVLPGRGAQLSLSAAVRDFEMEAITISGIRLMLDLGMDDIGGRIAMLEDTLGRLDSGAGDLLAGADGLSEGLSDYLEGLKALKDGLSSLSAGVADLSAAASSLSAGLSGLAEQGAALVSGAAAMQEAVFSAVNTQLEGSGLPTLTSENYAEILGDRAETAAIKAQLDGVMMFVQGLGSYTDGVAQLSSGAANLAGGAEKFYNSASVIPASANKLFEAGARLSGAMRELRDGLSEYKDGTGALLGGLDGSQGDISGILDLVTGGPGETVSFVSEKNTDVAAVQFVLKTPAIERPETPAEADEEPAALTFWQKLLRLFGL